MSRYFGSEAWRATAAICIVVVALGSPCAATQSYPGLSDDPARPAIEVSSPGPTNPKPKGFIPLESLSRPITPIQPGEPNTGPKPVSSATVSLVAPNLIRLSGIIDRQAADDFVKLAATIHDWAIVVLNSGGGDVSASMTIGRLIRTRSFETAVPKQDVCASACVLILAAGVERSAYGKIGIHRPHYDDSYFAGLDPAEALKKYQELEMITHDYLHDMGMPPDLFAMMVAVPSDQVAWLTHGQSLGFSLDGIDPGYEEWLRAQYAQEFGPDGYRRHLQGMALIGNCVSRGDRKCEGSVAKRYPEALWDPRGR